MAPLVSAEDSIQIPNSYIVIYKEDIVSTYATAEHENYISTLGTIQHKYSSTLSGYSGLFDENALAEIRKSPLVQYVEQDQVMYVGDMNLGMEEGANYKTQKKAPWGLSRVSHREFPSRLTEYNYPASAGSDVDVYVIDTGINVDHVDFEGRAKWGKTIPYMDEDIDGNGHGTHCAGTIAGKKYGIAKKANVIAVKVLRTNGYGSNADVLKGIEWVLEQHLLLRDTRKSVANMSLGGGRSMALDRAVDKCVEEGIHFAVAAGNESQDACNYSPAAAKKALTVGATNRSDVMAYFSNSGPCVDIFAPGFDIISTWIGSNVATNTISGTSMASPHVAGVLALYLGEKDYTTEELKKKIIADASDDLIDNIPMKTPNKLLNTNSLLE